MSHSVTKRTILRLFPVNVDELSIAGHFGKRIDTRLVDHFPFRRLKFFPNHRPEFIRTHSQCCHKATPLFIA
jgi:hypothetical protein